MEYCDDDREYIWVGTRKTNEFVQGVRHSSTMPHQRICSGDGSCLTQTSDTKTYGKYPDVICNHTCEPMKCPNFAVCGDISPQWLLRIQGGICGWCKWNVQKTLTFPDDQQECPVCMEMKTCVIQPNCSHSICVDCFKQMRVNGPEKPPKPDFPYPDQEDDYYAEDMNEHPLDINPTTRAVMGRYDQAIGIWEDECDRIWREAENLRKCPLCRA